MRQAATGLDVIDGDTLAGLALEEEVESRLISGAGRGPWELRHGPFEEEMFSSLPDNDWTLLVQSVDHYLAEVSLLLDSFSFLPAWRLEDIMISYAAKGGSVGPHFDQYDVFLVQASGSRRWQIGQWCDGSTLLLPHDSLKLLADFQVQEEFVLDAGDVLYLPPGLAHWGIADSDDCITWSVGLRSPDLYQAIDWLLAESEEERSPLLFTDAGRAPATLSLGQSDLDTLLAQAQQALAQLPANRLLTRWLSLPRQDTIELLDVDTDVISDLCPDAALVRHGGARLLVEDEDASHAWINGEGFPIPADARPLVRQLAASRLLTHAQLDALATAEVAQELLEDWIERGYFYSI
jgi:50S ribosomal protein L16 3-hydroxylase